MSIQQTLTQLIQAAHESRASDIHFMLEAEAVTVKFRLGSEMKLHETLTEATYNQLLAYIKFHASLTLAHPKQPQSGSMTIHGDGFLVNIRVSIIPTYRYQSLVLRIINQQNRIPLEDIPYFPQNAETLKEMVNAQAGLILISGPTGSGKTTTAYSLLQFLKDQGKSIVTIEDPVEYQMPDIVQIQVNESMGMTYDAGIREILRHDPDVIVIGEIRDAQTAVQAIRASLTGHLVISTVHSKNVLGTIHRLLDLGIAAQELEQSLIGVINQRLIKGQTDYKALLEICFGADLEQMFASGLQEKSYRTLDEEYDLWQQTAS